MGARVDTRNNDIDKNNESENIQNNETMQSKNEQPRLKNGKMQLQKGQPQGIAPTGKTVGDMIGAFESIVTVEYIRGVKNYNWKPFNKNSEILTRNHIFTRKCIWIRN